MTHIHAVSSLASRIRKLRIATGLTQKKFAKRAGLSPAHLCEIEKGRARPSPECLAKLALAFGMTVAELLEGAPYRERRGGQQSLHPLGSQLPRAFGVVSSQKDLLPTFHMAFHEARFTTLGIELLETVRSLKRPKRFWDLLKRLARDLNGYEQLFFLHLLAAGAVLEEVHPWRLGFRRPVVDANGGLFVAVVLKVDGGFIACYFQLGTVTGPGRFRTLDVLVGVGQGDVALWLDYEVDGRGHDGREQQDAERERQLRIVRVKVPLMELERHDFVARFVKSALGRLDEIRREANSNDSEVA